MSFKTIHITNNSSEAEVIKLQLTESGISTFLKDSMTAQVTGVPLEVGGIKIQVKENQTKDGILRLIELGYIKKEHAFQQETSPISASQAILLNKIMKVALAILLIGFAAYFAFS